MDRRVGATSEHVAVRGIGIHQFELSRHHPTGPKDNDMDLLRRQGPGYHLVEAPVARAAAIGFFYRTGEKYCHLPLRDPVVAEDELVGLLKFRFEERWGASGNRWGAGLGAPGVVLIMGLMMRGE